MSINDDSESLSQHPLFRALILMGGGLALGCGGVAQSETYTTENGGAEPGPATSTATAGGGASGASTSTSGAGTPIQLGQAGGISTSNGGAAGIPSADGCPYAQWDCSQLAPACVRELSQGLVGTGCFCNSTRPLTANDCAANESLFCQPGVGLTEPAPTTWDYTDHIQCSCAPTPAADDYEGAVESCLVLFPGETRSSMTAYLPSSMTCDGTVCTATSADVLRQEGIMCGCADVGLK